MKTLKAGIFFVLLTLVFSATSCAQEVSITIDEIVANGKISGKIRSSAPLDFKMYKVIVYVHTDLWYIHPYAGQGEGESWASIGDDGGWKIKTVKRRFKADKVAALLVKRNYPEPNKVENLENIQNTAIGIKNLRDTSDYGKL